MNDRAHALEDELAEARARIEALTGELEDARHYRSAIEASPVCILRVAAAAGRYVFVNDAFCRMLGYRGDEILARDPYQVWRESAHPDDLEAEHTLVGRLAKGEIDSFRLEKRVVPRQGEPRWVCMEAVASRDAEGRFEYMTAFFTDIEHERALARARGQLESQLREEQKLGAVGKLAGGIAHDFNNRLVVIMGYAELLVRALPEGSSLARQADMVLGSARRAAELTRQLLAYSRRQVLCPDPFNLNETVERVGSLLKTVLGDRVDLVTCLRATQPVLADKGQIEQVILNLVLNARDAMPTGGTLTLETLDVDLSAGEDPVLRPGKYVALVVTDTGTGIADDVLPHIFEPFFTTKETGRGTGLGLSMVEGIVQQSGGVTRVRSAVGKGTTFTIYLPHATCDAPVRPPVEEPPPRKGRFETVLLCDDDGEVRELMAAVLSLRGYSILKARNGRHALEVAERHRAGIDLLVTDMSMPELTGIELTTELRTCHPTLRVLYVSGHTEDADRLSALRGPGTHFLAKPFLPGDLTSTVSKILDGPGHSADAAR